MKTMLIILILSLQIEANDIKSSKKEIVSNSTIGHYQKPGLSMDLDYTTQKVDVGEMSDINITLINSSFKTGILEVKIQGEKEIDGLEEKNLKFTLSKDKRNSSITFQVFSAIEGVHYIYVFAKVNNERRAYAIPLYVGNIDKKLYQKPTQKLKSGENITVSRAEEEIY